MSDLVAWTASDVGEILIGTYGEYEAGEWYYLDFNRGNIAAVLNEMDERGEDYNMEDVFSNFLITSKYKKVVRRITIVVESEVPFDGMDDLDDLGEFLQSNDGMKLISIRSKK